MEFYDLTKPIKFAQIDYVNITVPEKRYTLHSSEGMRDAMTRGMEYLQKYFAELSKDTPVKRIVGIERDIHYDNNTIDIHCYYEVVGGVKLDEDTGIKLNRFNENKNDGNGADESTEDEPTEDSTSDEIEEVEGEEN